MYGHGRKIIYTDEIEVTRENVCGILMDAVNTHGQNRTDIQYLWDYYRGIHPKVLNRTKDYRPEILNKIVCNLPFEIVTFDTGYLMGEPVQYVSRGGDESVSDEIVLLNGYMESEEIYTKNKELADWFFICGTSYKMVLPDPRNEEDYSPFEIDIPDPRNTFVVYNSGFGHRPVLGVKYVTDKNGIIHYYCYSKDRFYEIDSLMNIVDEQPHDLRDVPIVEYPLNRARLGAFEVVLDLCDAIDTCYSNKVDGLEQFVQALMLFHNTDISDEDFAKIRERGGLKFKDIDPQMKANVSYLVSELNQSESQSVINNMYDMIRSICGIPNVNRGSASTADSGLAVLYRDGYATAEVNAKNAEASFKRSERQLLRIIMRICKSLRGSSLKETDIKIHFTRQNFENILAKSQVLTTMLNNPKIHPKLAFTHCGLFVDPDLAYQMSDEYMKEHEDAIRQETDTGTDQRNPADSQTWEPGRDPD